MLKNYNRRKFLKNTTLSTALLSGMSGLITTSSLEIDTPLSEGKYMGGFAAPKIKNIRAAFIGLGARGGDHLKFFASLLGTEVVALSDLYEDNIIQKLKSVKEVSEENRHNNIALYWGDQNKWKIMLDEVKPDVVFIATNWNNHAPMAIRTMEKGAHAFVEVPIAVTIEDIWKIVNTSERTQKHCMMLENVNYNRTELMFLNMCRQNVIGDILHGEAAYIHDLREQMNQENRGTGSWRTLHYTNGRGNLYPTHGLGPVAQYMNLSRTDDNFKSIVSYSTLALGRALYAKKNFSDNHKWNNLNFKNGDLHTSIIKTNIGRTIMIQWDETSPRPYTRHNLIQGTKGILEGHDINGVLNPIRIALDSGIEGVTENSHQWATGEGLEKLIEKYDHPLWKRLNKITENSGHGGMDGMMIYRVVECIQKGLPLDQNVYEGCFWSSVTPLSAKSNLEDGAPQKFPDFTRGKWVKTKPLGIIS